MDDRSTLENYELTAAGWPRPVVGGYPVPWVAPTENLAEVNEGRQLASVGGATCQVCGLDYAWAEQAYGFVFAGEEGLPEPEVGMFVSEIVGSSSQPIFFLDGAIMHFRCAKLSAARCPHIAGRTDLWCVTVPANDANPRFDEKNRLRPTYPAGDCEFVAWPVPRRTT